MAADTVIVRRFINTPTVKELYDEENQGEDLGVDQDTVDDLSDEYDQVSGNEQYYKSMFKYLPKPYQDLGSVAGNEGFFGWVKNLITGLIAKVKKFFRWIFSFFTSKQKISKEKTIDLETKIKDKGVKTEPVPYPTDAEMVWGKDAPFPNNLDWLVGSLKEQSTFMQTTSSVVGTIGKFAASASHELSNSNVKEENIKKIIEDAKKSIVKLLYGSESKGKKYLYGGYDISITEKWDVKLNPNSRIAKKNDRGQFVSTLNKVVDAHKEIKELCNKDFVELIKAISELEKTFIANLEESANLAKNASEKSRETEIKGIVRLVSDFTTSSMSLIKQLESIAYRSFKAGVAIVNAAVKD